MGFIDGIAIVLSDLVGVKADIARFGPSTGYTFATEIEKAKKEIYRIIREDYKKDYPNYSEAELDTDLATIKDMTGEYLKDKIVFQCLSDIMLANEMPDLWEMYKNKAKAINAIAYVDIDSDDVVDETEKRHTENVHFVRS